MPDLSASERRAYDLLAVDLDRVFRARLVSVVAYQPATGDAMRHALALVERLGFDDLAACLPLTEGWRRHGLAVPLILEQDEFRRTLDVFPLEYGRLIARHVVVHGQDPFEGVTIAPGDLRRACELQAKSHLIHLREGFLETRGDAAAVADLIAASATPFHSLLANIVHLQDGGVPEATDQGLAASAEARIGIPAATVRDVLSASRTGDSSIADPTALLARYIAVVERVWEYVDRWTKE